VLRLLEIHMVQAAAQTKATPTVATNVVAAAVQEPGTDLQPYGNSAIQAQMQEAVPTSSAQNPTSSFSVPAGGGIVGTQLTSSKGTGATAKVTGQTLSLSFSPAFVLDATWPMTNVELSSLTIDLKSGKVTAVDASSSQALAFGSGAGTAADIKTQVNAALAGIGVSGLGPYTAMSRVVAAIITPTKGVTRSQAAGVVSIPKTLTVGDASLPPTTVAVTLGLQGNVVSSVTLHNPIQLNNKGAPSVKATGSSIGRGGIANLMRAESLEPPTTMQGLAAGIRLLGYAASAASHPLGHGNPEWIEGGSAKQAANAQAKGLALLQALAPAIGAELKAQFPSFDWSQIVGK
jgi:hypothetical protein